MIVHAYSTFFRLGLKLLENVLTNEDPIEVPSAGISLAASKVFPSVIESG